MIETFDTKLRVFRAGIDEMSEKRAYELRWVNSSEAILANISFWADLIKGMTKQLAESMREMYPRQSYPIAMMEVDFKNRTDKLQEDIGKLVRAGKCKGKGSVLALAENERWTQTARSVPDAFERISEEIREHDSRVVTH